MYIYIYICIYICMYIYIYIYIYNHVIMKTIRSGSYHHRGFDVYQYVNMYYAYLASEIKHSIYRLVSLVGLFRVEKYTVE